MRSFEFMIKTYPIEPKHKLSANPGQSRKKLVFISKRLDGINVKKSLKATQNSPVMVMEASKPR